MVAVLLAWPAAECRFGVEMLAGCAEATLPIQAALEIDDLQQEPLQPWSLVSLHAPATFCQDSLRLEMCCRIAAAALAVQVLACGLALSMGT